MTTRITEISDIKAPWRIRYTEASFRGAVFHIDNMTRTGRQRNVVHEYPKRPGAYIENMGLGVRAFAVQAHLIGPDYLDYKEDLLNALEKEGVGTLKLPMQSDRQVEAMRWDITESRLSGGYCVVEMHFLEQGEAGNAVTAIMTNTEVVSNAETLEKALVDNLNDRFK